MYIRQSKKWQLTVVYFRLLSLNLGLRHKFTQYANICTCQILQSNNIQVLKASKPTYYYGSSSYRPKEVAAQARSTSSSSSSSPPRAYSYATTYGENEKNTNPLISHTVRILNPRRAIHRSKPTREFMNRRNRQHRKQSQHHRAAKPVNQQQQQQLSPNSTLKRRNLALRSSHPQTGQATSVFASKERGERGPIGPRGPAGICHIERCVDAVEQRLAAKEQVMKLKQPEAPEPIAFNVGLASNFSRTHQNHGIVVYDTSQLISRHGKPGGYDMRSGIFRAPEAGIYHFTTTAFALTKPLFLSIVEERKKRLCTITSQIKYQTASCSATTRLERGATVYVQLVKGELFGHSYLFSTFTGYKLS